MSKNCKSLVKNLIFVMLLSVIALSGFIIYSDRCKNTIHDKQLLYSTDIAIDGDFDDYFDLAALYTLDRSIIPTIIVDGTDENSKQTGLAAIFDFAKTVGRSDITDSVVIGRNENLQDSCDSHCKRELVDYLQHTEGKIDVLTVGSLRDIAALYNHEPDIFENKVENIYVFAGDAEGTYMDYNVGLDETAFLRIMNSGLNIYWIPCFQNGLFQAGNNASYMQIAHQDILENADTGLLKWLLYRFEMSDTDFESYMKTEHDTANFMADIRNIWCAPLFPILDGSMEEYLQKYNETNEKNIKLPFGFADRRVLFQENGKVLYGEGNVIHVFEIYDYEEYLNLSKFILRTMFSV